MSVVLPGVTWKTPQFSLYIWFWCVCSGCNMTKTKISIMHMAKTKISIINIIRECDCSRLYFKNASIFIFSVFVPGVTCQKQKLPLCIWLVIVIVLNVTWKTHQFSLYIYDFCVFVPRCIMTKTKISIMHMISKCGCSRCYLKNTSIFIVYKILVCLFRV